MSNYLIQGGDGYSMFSENEGVTKGESAVHFLSEYFGKKSPIAPEEEFRIADVQQLGLSDILECSSSSGSQQFKSTKNVVQTFFIFTIVTLLML